MNDISRANEILGEKSGHALIRTLRVIGTLDDLIAQLTEIGVADRSAFLEMVVSDFSREQRERFQYIRKKILVRKGKKMVLQRRKKYGIVIRDDKGRGTRLKKIQSQAHDG